MSTDRIKVLHFFKAALPESVGGTEIFMDRLSNETADLQIENTIFSLSKKPVTRIRTYKKYKMIQSKQDFFVASTGFSFSAFYIMKQLSKEADIIHYHYPNPFADLLHFLLKIKKPTIITYHSDIVRQKKLLFIYKPLRKYFLDSANKIIATSPNYLKTSEVLKKYSPKVEVIPIGLSKADIAKPSKLELKYWKKLLPSGFFVFVGAMRYYKGLFIALEALRGTEHQLVLVGTGSTEKELKKYVKKYDMKNILFVGNVSEESKFAILALSRALILPSHLRSEAFGISLVEAALMEKALISCELGTGTSYVNVHNQTGLVIPPESPFDLQKALDFIVDHPKKAEEFGKNAKKRALALFSSKKMAKRYVDIYKTLLMLS